MFKLYSAGRVLSEKMDSDIIVPAGDITPDMPVVTRGEQKNLRRVSCILMATFHIFLLLLHLED